MATAVFFAQDTATEGNWVGAYGADGWFLEGDSPQSSYPSYVTTPSFSGWSGPFDAGANTDARALQKASNHSVRSDSLLYTNGTGTVDFTITGTKKITFYVWAGDSAHGQSVSVLDMDSGGTVLDTRTIPNNYTNGTYLSWNASGHIRLSITNTSGINGGRISGLFFDPAATFSPAISSVSPPFILPGTTVTVSITGAYTNFVNGTTTVGISGSGLTVGSPTVTSSTSLSFSVTAASGAAVGTRTLTVTTGTEVVTAPFGVGALHAYWRLYFTNSFSSAISIAEWKLFDGTSAQIATTGGTASASSAVSGDPASSAFDANLSTFWASAAQATPASPQWLQYQFGSAVDVRSVSITNRTSFPTQSAYDVALQFSDTGSNWTTLYQWLGVNWNNSGTQQTVTLGATNAAPQTLGIAWRLNVTANAGFSDGTVAIAEWQLKDDSGSAIATTPYAARSDSTVSTEPDGAFAAFDGNAGTYWASGSGTEAHWIAYDFADPTVNVGSFCLVARNDVAWTQAPTAFTLQKSTDRVTWTTTGVFTATWTAAGQSNCGFGSIIAQPQISVIT